MKSIFTSLSGKYIMIIICVILFSNNLTAQIKHVVGVTNNVFTPKTIKINKGDTVEWQNTQGFHNVNGMTSTYPSNPESFGNATGNDWTWSHVFTIPGKYDYRCDPHVNFGMVGIVEVTGDGGNEVVLNCPANLSIPACQNLEEINTAFEVWLNTVSTSGGCDVNITNNAPVSIDMACEGGAVTVMFTATPINGFDTSCKTKTCSATFTVEPADVMSTTCAVDRTEPSCQSQADIDQAYEDWLNSVVTTGGCTVTIENNAPTTAPLVCEGGSVTVTFTVKDSISGGEVCKIDNCTATFTIEAPDELVLTCPADQTELACQTQAEIDNAYNKWISMATASGGCDASLSNDAPVSSPLTCEGGSVTVTFTATDINAEGVTCKTETCTSTFIVEAPEVLSLKCPSIQMEMACQNEDSINSKFQAWLTMTTVVGGCNTIITNDAPDVLPVICENDIVTVTFTATDSNGDGSICQTQTCTSTFTIQLPEPPKLIVDFSNMTPHLGQKLWLSVIEKGTGKEIDRKGVIVSSEFSIQIPNLAKDSSYFVNIFADHNGNGSYDSPPTDHAWQLELNNVVGDTTLNFAHNTDFTDINWKNKLTVNFTGMNPHLGQDFWFAVIDKESGEEKIRLELIVAQEFMIHAYGIEVGKSYNINFFSDHNGSRTYDAPPIDHAWQMELNDVEGDTTLHFSHNTNFTDINLSTGIETISTSQLNFASVYPNPASNKVYISLNIIENQYYNFVIYNPAGVQMRNFNRKGSNSPVEIDVREFESGLYFLKVSNQNQTGIFKFIKR